jgi:hypothetical protein
LGVSFLRENQDAGVRVGFECQEQDVLGTKKLCDAAGRAVANAQENEFGRMAEDQTALMKISVLGNDGVTVLLSKRPEEHVVGVNEAV